VPSWVRTRKIRWILLLAQNASDIEQSSMLKPKVSAFLFLSEKELSNARLSQ